MIEGRGLLWKGVITVTLVFLAGCSSSGTTEPPDNPPPVMETWYSCNGTPTQCLKLATGWTLVGEVITDQYFGHVSALQLPDDRIRVYGEYEPNPIGSWNPTLQCYVSAGGSQFTLESGAVAGGGRIPNVVRLPAGEYRMYYEGSGGVMTFKSALSSDGLNFTEEPGDRLVGTGTENEAVGFSSPRVVELQNGTYRMYYTGENATTQVLLSAVSADGLAWTREDGIRIDGKSFCADWTTIHQVGPIIDSTGTVRIYFGLLKCDSSKKNDHFGIYEFTSSDGLSFTWNSAPIVEGYYIQSRFNNRETDPRLFPVDPYGVLTPEGLRLYFVLEETPFVGVPVTEQGVYCIINPSIH